MAKIINVIGSCSNVGKTFVMEGIIKELKSRNYKIATIKHDVHGFDIDHEGKDTYKHRMAGSDTVIISSKNRFAKIMELKKELNVYDIIKDIINDYDFILVEGYKKSNIRKIEVYDKNLSSSIITKKENLIAVATNDLDDGKLEDLVKVKKDDFKTLVNFIELETNYN
ncbi:MAG: molybdopterin-guanine dinucleotide biosynthesis protein B [Peptostreptococcaceae bacterium]